MINQGHPYRFKVIDYVYVLTILDEETSMAEGFSYHLVEATEDITDLSCDRGYKLSRGLLIDERKLKIWSDDARVEPFEFTIKLVDDFEPHKHPRQVNAPIRKGETFNWYTFTQEKIKTPTVESIEEARTKGWRLTVKPIFYFFHDYKPVDYDSLAFYFPQALKPFNYSKTFKSYDFDQGYYENGYLRQQGIDVERKDFDNQHPLTDLQRLLHKTDFKIDHWQGKSYFKTQMEYRVKKIVEPLKDAIFSVGFMAPDKKRLKESLFT